MYAVFQSGGKQHRVKKDQTIFLEKLDASKDDIVEFKQVMLITNGDDIQIGNPFVRDAKITAQVIAHSRADKVIIVKFRRRKHYRKHQGHRQWVTNVKIIGIYGS